MLRKLLIAPVVAGSLLVAAAVPSSATDAPRPTIAGIVAASGGTFDQNNSDFDLLLTAVSAAGLVDALNNPAASLTVFAPNDRAFIRTARDLGFTGWDETGAWNFLVGALTQIGGGDPIPVLKNVLLYHVAPKALKPGQVLERRRIETLLTGASFGVRGLELIDNEPDLRNPKLDLGGLNIKASNGIIHKINRVLIPVNL